MATESQEWWRPEATPDGFTKRFVKITKPARRRPPAPRDTDRQQPAACTQESGIINESGMISAPSEAGFHCLQVQFEAKVNLDRLFQYGYSIRLKNGIFRLARRPSGFELLQGKAALPGYIFATSPSATVVPAGLYSQPGGE